MFSKFSFRTKIILFIVVLAVAVVSIMFNSDFQFPIGKNVESTTKDNSNPSTYSKNSNKEREKKTIEDEKQYELEEKAEAENKIAMLDKAEADKQKALEDEYNKGHDIYDSGSDKTECIKVMDDILSKDDKFYKAYTLKGIALCDTNLQNRFQDAIKNLDKALEIKPDYGYGLFNKAYALEKYAQYDEAIIWYNKALDVEKFVWSYYGLSSIYGRRGDVENTVKYLKLAIDLDPKVDVKGTARNEEDFNNVKNSEKFKDLLK